MKKNLNQTQKDQVKYQIIQTVQKEKPETTKKLIALMQERNGVPPKQTIKLIVELENEGQLHFPRPEQLTSTSAGAYIFSQKALWYWITIVLSITTTSTIFAIPDSDYPIVYLRSALAIMLIVFLPGYALIKLLFPTKLPKTTPFLTRNQTEPGSESTATLERIALSVGLSLALVPLIGLILNYTPWGIRFTPMTLSLLALTIAFATAAIIREHQTKVAT
jgi:hypothetical protein